MQAVLVPPPLAKRRPDVPVEVLAARTLSLATLGPRRRESAAALEALAGASLLELRQRLPSRFWIVAMLSLTGKSVREIAALVGYAGPAPVHRALRHPAVVKLPGRLTPERATVGGGRVRGRRVQSHGAPAASRTRRRRRRELAGAVGSQVRPADEERIGPQGEDRMKSQALPTRAL